MTWKLPQQEYQPFRRNVLDAVIGQLRFHPILKIRELVPDYQDKIRHSFPAYKEATVRNVTVGPGGMEVSEEQQFVFASAAERTTITLSRSALTLETRKHSNRQDFQQEMSSALQALVTIADPVAGTRLGLRYINTIRPTKISADLGREVDWGELIKPEFLRMTGDLTDLKDTLFMHETRSKAAEGYMTVRCGLIPTNEGSAVYRLDCDRYVEDSVSPEQAATKLGIFATDIYAVFRSAAADTLIEWLEPLNKGN